jgi:hypothetical protein
MRQPLNVKRSVGTVLIVAGAVWAIMFSRPPDLLRPDSVASVAIGLGLLALGIGVLAA